MEEYYKVILSVDFFIIGHVPKILTITHFLVNVSVRKAKILSIEIEKNLNPFFFLKIQCMLFSTASF